MSDQELLDLYEAHGRNASPLADILGVSRSQARRRIAAAKLRAGDPQMILDRLDPDVKNRIVQELYGASVPAEGSRVSSVWLKGSRVSVHMVPDRKDEDVPPWHELVVPAPPSIITYTDAPRILRKTRSVVGYSDAQIWLLRNQKTDELMPMHDPLALEIMEQITADVQPDEQVYIGDWMDWAPFSRYPKHAEMRGTTNVSIREGAHWLDRMTAAAGPRCAKRMMIGSNHQIRLERTISEWNLEAVGMRSAAAAPNDWPIFSEGFLLGFKERGIEFSGQFPGGEYWMLDDLLWIHAPPRKSEFQASVIHGHTHKNTKDMLVQHGRRDGASSRFTYYMVDIGCLCQLGTTSDLHSLMVTRVASDRGRTNWAQGGCVVNIVDDKFPIHQIEPIHIDSGRALFGGHLYTARSLDEAAAA